MNNPSPGILKKWKTALNLAVRYPLSLMGARMHTKAFQDVETFCIFIGYPRSGHSLIGALLDAHPDIIIAHALGALKYVQAGFSRNQLFYLLLRNSQRQAREGRRQDEYDLSVPHGWQGRFRKLRVIGDKRGSDTTLRLRSVPGLLDRLRRRIGLRIRVIHVYRNPYDNISTICRRHRMTPSDGISFYFRLCETVEKTKADLDPGELFEFGHESFVAEPEPTLTRICEFLGVGTDDAYLRNCSRIVFPAPRKTRFETNWSKRLILTLEEKKSLYPYLKDYVLDDP
jgi:hypothetical protein